MEDTIRLQTVKDRLKYYLRSKKITERAFAASIEVSSGYVNAISKSIQPDKLQRISMQYPDLNQGWLLTGDGSMLNTGTEPVKYNGASRIGIPLIPIEAVAGFGHGDQAGVRYEDCEQYSVPEFMERGVEFLVRVSGSSMYPKYANGDILACKKIHEILFIQWGKVHVIESASQGTLVKRIFEHDTDTVRCVSDNKENYPAFLMPKSDIRSLSIVLGVIRLE